MSVNTFLSPGAAATHDGVGILRDLATRWSASSAAVALLLPWSLVLGYALYYWFFVRPAKMERTALGPFLTFYTLLTDGATAGFDTQLMSVLHPALFKDGKAERGLLRAMARCLTATFGPVERVPRETVVLKRSGMQVNCVALVDFARKQQVTCQLSWVRRIPSVRRVEAQRGCGPPLPGRAFTADEVVDGIGMAPLNSFHVTSFHVEQRDKKSRTQHLDVLKYLRVEEFEPFVELFVERFFERPPVAAVRMMLPALQERHLADGGEALEASVQKILRTCGGLGSHGRPSADVDATLVREAIVKSAGGGDGSSATPAPLTAIDGIDMTYRVACLVRDLEVSVRLTIVGMRCYVARYELSILPDERTQVVVDRDSGETTIIA